MSRMIDADALKEKKVYSHERHEKIVPVAEIDWMPTIPAIPVGWLKSKRKEALHEGMRPDEVEAVEMVLWMWQKEQEAQAR